MQEAQIALDSDAGYVPGHTLLALIYAQLRQNAQADAHFRQALSLSEGASVCPPATLRNSYAWYLCQTDRMAQGLNELSPVLRDPLYGSLDKALVNASVCAARLEQYSWPIRIRQCGAGDATGFCHGVSVPRAFGGAKSQMARGAGGLANDAKLWVEASETPETLGCSHALSMVRRAIERARQSGCKAVPCIASQEAKWLRAEQWQWF